MATNQKYNNTQKEIELKEMINKFYEDVNLDKFNENHNDYNMRCLEINWFIKLNKSEIDLSKSKNWENFANFQGLSKAEIKERIAFHQFYKLTNNFYNAYKKLKEFKTRLWDEKILKSMTIEDWKVFNNGIHHHVVTKENIEELRKESVKSDILMEGYIFFREARKQLNILLEWHKSNISYDKINEKMQMYYNIEVASDDELNKERLNYLDIIKFKWNLKIEQK